jgi:hypothetical protein
MRKSAGIIGDRDPRGENGHPAQSCPYSLADEPRRARRSRIGHGSRFHAASGQKGSTANRAKKTTPARGIEKGMSGFTAMFARQPVRRAATVAIWPRRPQNRFCHAAAYCKRAPAS